MNARLFLSLALGAMAWLALPNPAHAQQHGCAVNQLPPLDFGRPAGNPTSAVETTADLTLTCEGNQPQRNARVKVCVMVAAAPPRQMAWFGIPFLGVLPYAIDLSPSLNPGWTAEPGYLSSLITLDQGPNNRPSGSGRVTLRGQLVPGQYGGLPGTYDDDYDVAIRSSTNTAAACTTLALRDTETGQAQARLYGSCSIQQVSDLAFGSTADLDSDLYSQATLDFDCTVGTAYTISLDGGRVGQNVAARKMQLAGGTARIAYELRHTGGSSGPIWGDGTAATTPGRGTGNGAESVVIHGRVPGGQGPRPVGTYNDTVTVTVEY